MVLGKVRRSKSHPGCSLFPNTGYRNHDVAKEKNHGKTSLRECSPAPHTSLKMAPPISSPCLSLSLPLSPCFPSEKMIPGSRPPIHKSHRRCHGSIDCTPHSKPSNLVMGASWVEEVVSEEHHYSPKLGLPHASILGSASRAPLDIVSWGHRTASSAAGC
jgi:hypothetical protein